MGIDAAFKEQLAKQWFDRKDDLAQFVSDQAKNFRPPVYSSIDLRDAGFKIAPVDSNLFPAGFNNICPEDQRTAADIIRRQIQWRADDLKISLPKTIVIVPESHTSNRFYIENLWVLRNLIRSAGFECQVGWLGPDPIELEAANEEKVSASPLQVDSQGKVKCGDVQADWLLLNNDFSGGFPEWLDQVRIPVMPSYQMGWHTRRKSDHFVHYNQIATEFAKVAGIDPWTITVDTTCVDGVNFNESIRTEEVAQQVDEMIARIGAEYAKRNIDRKPFVFVKNNSGTYGMGISVVHSGDEVRHFNRREKNKMSVGKGKAAITSVVIQEGIPTTVLIDRLPAEPVIYLFGCDLLGGFLRTNTQRGDEDNLNSAGMVFRKLCVADLREALADPEGSDGPPVLEMVYGTIARLSALAAGKEMGQNQKQILGSET